MVYGGIWAKQNGKGGRPGRHQKRTRQDKTEDRTALGPEARIRQRTRHDRTEDWTDDTTSDSEQRGLGRGGHAKKQSLGTSAGLDISDLGA